MKNMRHVVNVMRPTQALGTRGEGEGKDQQVLKDVPCSIETLSGREAELARSVYPDATYKVEMYADPSNPVTAVMYLTGGTIGTRRLHIGFVNDSNNMGTASLTLLCGEDLSGG